MSKHRTIDVRPQRELSTGQLLALCRKGITHRLLRSVLTLAVVALAVAFFMYLLAENAFMASTAQGVRAELDRHRLAARVLARLYEVPRSADLARDFAGASQARLDEYARVTRWESARIQRLASSAAREKTYLDFFAALPLGKRVVLVGRRTGRDILHALRDPALRTPFHSGLAPMHDVALPGSTQDFNEFLDGYGAWQEEMSLFAEAWRSAVERGHATALALTDGQDVGDWLPSSSAAQRAERVRLVTDAGFVLRADDVDAMAEQLATARLRQRLVADLNSDAKRQAWRQAFRTRKQTPLDEKLLALGDPRAIEVLGPEYDVARLGNLADRMAMERRLSHLDQGFAGRVNLEGDATALTGRQVFLLIISFVVCTVGIANAMLMSITERFREIATMKCLGATDRFILTQFMLEAALQGAGGGVLGMLAGFLISLLKGTLSYRGFLFTFWPGLPLLGIAVGAVFAGILLSVLASLYPSWTASRMAPMEAMRVE